MFDSSRTESHGSITSHPAGSWRCLCLPHAVLKIRLHDRATRDVAPRPAHADDVRPGAVRGLVLGVLGVVVASGGAQVLPDGSLESPAVDMI